MTTSAAIAQSNLAVAHLKTNGIRQAIVLCTSALEQQQRSSIARGIQLKNGSSAEVNPIDLCMLLLDPPEQQSEETNAYFVYKAGILIPSTVTDPNVITPIIIYNTALAHHCLAEQQASLDVAYALKLLERAQSLYELAYKAISTGSNPLFEFVVVNNLAMIHRALELESKANMYFDYLLASFMIFVDRNCSAHLRHVGEFLVNLPNTVAFAAAA